MRVVFDDEQMSFQTLRLLSEIQSGQADVNEVISTARKIYKGNYESWYLEWTKTADRVKKCAEKFLSGGHYESAANTFLRASNYYRAAGFYRGVLIADGCDEGTKKKLKRVDDLSLECFANVIKYGKQNIKRVEIPYENTTLPGHFYKAGSDYKSAPTLIMMNGYDGTKEEFYGYAAEALKRGMNCFTFEGPGQGEMIRRKNIPFRPDWEKVVTPVVDYLINTLGVNPDKIILWGESFGGYLAPRAVAFEHRILACVANSGVYDFMGDRGPDGTDREAFFGWVESLPESAVDKETEKMMASNVQMNWAVKHGIYVFGAKSIKDYMIKSKGYYLGNAVKQIKCHMLVTDSENENNFPGQAKKLYELLDCPKDYFLFTHEGEAEEHCQEGAKIYANDYIFNWIEDILKTC